MYTLTRTHFTTIKTEGGILPADLLQRVATGRGLDGLTPEAYHLFAGERLNEAINRSWNRCLGAWRSFSAQREALPANDRGTTLTRERWLLILFQELGYGRLQFASGGLSLDPADPAALVYPVSHRWEAVPIHLLSFRDDLDRRGAEKRSPHSLVQEYLNRAEGALWGFLSNGLRLRILRDNASLTRAAYVEFDLEAMMTGELYADFSLLWLACHQSRVEGVGSREVGSRATPHSPLPTPSSCWLERWSQSAAEQGVRALDALRDGVQEAIEALGRGFLAHPANSALRKSLQTGELSSIDYYRQLLRLVYRLIILFVAEDRELFFPPETPPDARQRYAAFYSLGRLRETAALLRGSPHPDLYRGLRLLFEMLRIGYGGLGVPALGGFLFSPRATPALDAADIANEALLDAIRALTFTVEGKVRRAVDYRNLDSEELGSVYESLLELHPQVNVAAASFALAVVAGSERKTTGTHYTATPLVSQLLDSALEPVIAARIARAREIGSREIGSKEVKNGRRGRAVLPGPGGLAERHGSGRGVLPADAELPARGDIRADLPDPAGGNLDPSERGGGLRPGTSGRLYAVPADRAGLPERGGDAPAAGGPRATGDGGRHSADTGSVQRAGENPARADSGPAEGGWEIASGKTGTGKPGSGQETGPYSLLPTPYSLLEHAILSIRVLDYASGSGHILIGAARRLARRLAQIRTGDEEPSPADLRAALRDVVRHCIYGVDINPMAVELCKVALWLETLEPGKPLSFLDHHIQCGNSLVGTGIRGSGVGNRDLGGRQEQQSLELAEDEEAGLVVPDEAFVAVAGDDKKAASFLRKLNRTERSLNAPLIILQTQEDLARWQRTRAAALEAMPEDSAEQVAGKASAYEGYLASPAYRREKLAHDLWTAAFFWPIQPGAGTGASPAPTHGQLARARAGQPLDESLSRQVAALSERVPFFHWTLAFPEVFGEIGSREVGNREVGNLRPTAYSPLPPRGFDCVLSNPPWERIKLQEEEFFAARDPEIAGAANKAARQKLLDALPKTNPMLYDAFMAAKHDAEATSKFVRASGRFPLTAVGDVNTYALFAELARTLLAPAGRAGIIVPTGIATDDTTKAFFGDLVETGSLARLIGYENEAFIFPAVHHAFKFCLLTMTGSAAAVERADLAFFCRHYEDAGDPRRRFTLSGADFALINPNTRTCPIFRTRADAELTKGIYQRIPVFVSESSDRNPWQSSYRQGLFHSSSDSDAFNPNTQASLTLRGARLFGNTFQTDQFTYLPLYEGRMIWQFDHRYGSYETRGDERGYRILPETTLEQHQNSARIVLPFYWVKRSEVDDRFAGKWSRTWTLVFRDITANTVERTTIACVLPYVGVSDQFGLIQLGPAVNTIRVSCLLACMNSLILDFVTRQKIGGNHLKKYALHQLPLPAPDEYSFNDSVFIVPRVLELVYTAWDIKAFADDVWRDAAADLTGLRDLSGLIRAQWEANRAATGGHTWNPPAWAETAVDGCPLPPFKWDEDRRAVLRAELDAYYARLYGLTRDELRYILDPKDVYGPDFPGETFRVLKEKEERAYGEYRTRRLVLAAWDRLEPTR